jgi:hypothetical protein
LLPSHATRFSRDRLNTEFLNDRLNDVSGMRHDGNDNRPFVWLWLLQAFELAIEQRRGHEVIGAGGDAPCHHVAIAF